MSHKRPLLRGTLTALLPWRDSAEISGYEVRDAQIAVWCPYCAARHYHGWAPENTGRWAEHRVAHCCQESPLHETGYWISVSRKNDPEYAGHVVTPGIPITRPKEITVTSTSSFE